MNKLRFPENVLKAARPEVEPTDDSPREAARARGANACRQWILWLYGEISVAPKMSLRFELPGGHRPNKLEFVRLLGRASNDFEQHYGFDSSNGAAQVRAKDIGTNEAYGFYDEIDMLGTRFDFWELLEKDGRVEALHDLAGVASPTPVARKQLTLDRLLTVAGPLLFEIEDAKGEVTAEEVFAHLTQHLRESAKLRA